MLIVKIYIVLPTRRPEARAINAQSVAYSKNGLQFETVGLARNGV